MDNTLSSGGQSNGLFSCCCFQVSSIAVEKPKLIDFDLMRLQT
jgi:hypothetical protein